MKDLGWYFAVVGWAGFLTQLGWTARAYRHLREAHMREGEYCCMLDRLRNERHKTDE